MWKYKPLKFDTLVPDLLPIPVALNIAQCNIRSSAPVYFWRFCIIISFLSLYSESFSQEKYLVLDKPGRIKRIRYYSGDEIIFKLKGDITTYSTMIQAIGDSTILVRDTPIPIRNIHSITKHSENGFLYQAARILPKAGMLYFLADTFNPVFRGEKPDISRSGVVVGGTLIAGGYALKLFRKRTYRINNYRTLKILQTF
jgi:hypothetical protein